MKYVILRCEDGGGSRGSGASLLEGARMAHLHQLGHAGAVGLIVQRKGMTALERVHVHRALFGLAPADPDASPGQCYAASMNRQLAPDETVWCCEFMTQRDGRVVDPTAGAIPTKEAGILIHALEDELGSDTRTWELGQDSHHILVVRDPALRANGQPQVLSPEHMVGQLWRRRLPRSPSGAARQALITQASTILEHHEVNRVRVDLGENPANMLWLWGAADARPQRTLNKRLECFGAVVSTDFFLRGFARILGLDWRTGPASLDEGPLQHFVKTIATLMERVDFLYGHLTVESSDPVTRLCAMERIDHIVLSALTELLPRLGSWRLLTAIDDSTTGAVPFVAIGTGLPKQPAAHLSASEVGESPLKFEEGVGVFPWFTSTA